MSEEEVMQGSSDEEQEQQPQKAKSGKGAEKKAAKTKEKKTKTKEKTKEKTKKEKEKKAKAKAKEEEEEEEDGGEEDDGIAEDDEAEAKEVKLALEAAAEEEEDTKKDVEMPKFGKLKAESVVGKVGYSKVNVPQHRVTPLKTSWPEIYKPIVNYMGIIIRFNPRKKAVELKTSEKTENPTALQKSADFVQAFILGFEVRDAIALLRLDDLYLDSFEIKDVKTLEGEHKSRAIGRIAGQGGKTKFTIENATKTRIVVANTHIHILGSFSNIKIAKSAISRLIMGAPPGKVYTQMRAVATRLKERF